jgi:hypothetical protein
MRAESGVAVYLLRQFDVFFVNQSAYQILLVASCLL